MDMIDMVGRKFGKLEVVAYHHSNNGVYWLCRCDCGKQSVAKGTNLRSGATRSCGCGSIEQALKNLEIHHRGTHGKANKERLYETWKNMRRRCNNPKDKRYAQYGGKGIKVCAEWDSYENFREWAMKNGYDDSLTIERIDINQNYCPENCRWATWKEQAQNTSRTHSITYNGKTQSLSMWADEFGITYSSMQHRIQRGWDMDRISRTPMRKRHEP